MKTFISNFSISESFAWTFLTPNFFSCTKILHHDFTLQNLSISKYFCPNFYRSFPFRVFFLSNLFLKALFRIVCINLVNFFICINHLCLNHVCWDISTVQSRTSRRPQIRGAVCWSRLISRSDVCITACVTHAIITCWEFLIRERSPGDSSSEWFPDGSELSFFWKVLFSAIFLF